MRVELGEVVIDTDAREIRRGGAGVHLSPKAFDLLELLIAARPRALRKQELYDALWPDTFVVEANLPVLIREIRVALGDTSHEIIRTVARHGYAFGGSAPGAPTATHLILVGKQEFALFEGDNTVGRDPKATVRIVSTSVSRRHATITVDGDEASVVDLDSKNGTKVDGKLVTELTPLRDGSVVTFGAVDATYRVLSATARTETVV